MNIPTKTVEVIDQEACRRIVKRWMTRKTISYRALARTSGITYSNLNATLNGHRAFTQEVADKLFPIMERNQ